MPGWLRLAVQVHKGIHVFFAFVLFGCCIVLVTLVIIPFFAIVKAAGVDPTGAMRWMFSVIFRAWLWFLRLSRLVTWEKPKGICFDGPCVIIANHPGLFDVLFLAVEIPGLSMLVKSSLARTVHLGPIFRYAGYVLSPDERMLGSVQDCINSAISVLKRGEKFVIFPEGTRSPRGGLGHFKAGAVRIAQRAGVPVQPVLIRNVPPLMSHEDRWYLPPYEISRFTMEFLEPIPVGSDDKCHRVTLEIEEMFAGLLGYGVPAAVRNGSKQF